MLKLQFKDNPNRSLWLVGDKVTLGSHTDNTVVLDGLGIEDFHAELLVDGDRVLLKSEPGTCMVNDLPVDGEFTLGANDELRIGKERLLIVDPRHQPEPPRGKPAARPSESTPAQWSLVPDHARLQTEDFSIRDRAVLGRSRDCEFSVPYKLLSREHAALYLEDGELWLRDLGSSNGSFVNGQRVDQAKLHDGDKIAFAKLVFSVKGPAGAGAQNDPAPAREPEAMNRTMIRPALKLEQEQAAREASAASRSIELEPRPEQEDGPAEAAAADSRGSALILVSVVAVAAALGVAWYFLV